MNANNKSMTLLFNPFFYVAGARALGIGVAAILITGLVASWGHTHFDGVIDTHVGAAAPLWVFFCEGLIDWICLSIVLYFAGKLISHTAFRAIDVLGTQALARWPAFFISLIALPRVFQRFGNTLVQELRTGKFNFNATDAILFFLIVAAMVPFLCWMVALMYKSFSVSCNVKGGKAIGFFIGALLLAEALSKVCLAPIFHETLAQSLPKASVRAGIVTGGKQFVDLLAQGNFAQAETHFDETMKSAMPEAALRDAWQTLLKQAGTFQKQTGARAGELEGYQIAYVTCQFARAILDIKVVFDADGRVAGLFFVSSGSQ